MPWPIGLVVKNGSNTRAITSGGMPVPVSVTQSERYWPSGMSCWRAARSSIHLLAVSMVMRPPSGIASRALMHRLSSAFSSCGGSTSAGQRPDGADDLDGMAGPTVRRISSSMPVDEPVHVGGLRVERLAAREGEQAVGQGGGALGGALRRRHVAVDIVEAALLHARLHQLQRAGDAGEQVVEVVRQAAGELADRLHLLGLAQGLLGLHQLGRPLGTRCSSVSLSSRNATVARFAR